MAKNFLGAIALVGCSFFGGVSSSPATATTIALVFDSLPSAQGWTYTSGPSTGSISHPEHTVYAVDGTTLTQTMVDKALDIDATAGYEISDPLDKNLNTIFRLRARVIDYETSGDSFSLGFDIQVHTDTRFALGFTDDNVVLSSTGGLFEIVGIDTSVFHDYRVEMLADGGLSLFIDDVLRGSGVAGAAPTRPWSVRFGDRSGFENANVEITEFSITQQVVPEPATTMLLAAGLVGFGALRNRKFVAYNYQRK